MVEISGKTRLVGLIGWPVGHSLSPAIHNAAAADLGLDLAYLPLSVREEELQAALQGFQWTQNPGVLREPGWQGNR